MRRAGFYALRGEEGRGRTAARSLVRTVDRRGTAIGIRSSARRQGQERRGAGARLARKTGTRRRGPFGYPRRAGTGRPPPRAPRAGASVARTSPARGRLRVAPAGLSSTQASITLASIRTQSWRIDFASSIWPIRLFAAPETSGPRRLPQILDHYAVPGRKARCFERRCQARTSATTARKCEHFKQPHAPSFAGDRAAPICDRTDRPADEQDRRLAKDGRSLPHHRHFAGPGRCAAISHPQRQRAPRTGGDGRQSRTRCTPRQARRARSSAHGRSGRRQKEPASVAIGQKRGNR